MDPIRSISDLYAAGAHWVAAGMVQAGRGFAAFVSRLRTRFGELLQATADTLQSFWRLTGQAMRSATLIGRGLVPRLGDIPVLDTIPSQQRFITQGVAKIVAPGLGEPGQPFSTSLPFERHTPNVPTLGEINSEIQSVLDDDTRFIQPTTDRRRKRRERYKYIQDRGEPIEYDIAPLFIWRTS